MTAVPSLNLSRQSYTQALTKKRKSLGYGITTLARTLDKGTFVKSLRPWVMPTLIASSLAWLGLETAYAPEGEKTKKFTQIGLGALGTGLGAWWGFKYILRPDPHTAGAIGKLIVEHFPKLLKKADFNQLAFKSKDLLGKSLGELKLGHLFKGKNLNKTTLNDVIEEITDPEDVFKILDHLNIPLGKFKKTLSKALTKASKLGDDGLPEKELQKFRIDLLKHVFDEHGVTMSPKLLAKLNKTTGNSFHPRNIHQIRQELEKTLDDFTNFKDIQLDQLNGFKDGMKGFLKARIAKATEFLNTIVPGPGHISSKEMMGEIKDLTKMGLLPVLGGIAGGSLGDVVTHNNWTTTIKDKSKEGLFQFLANIMLCNVGAMAFLGVTELTAKRGPAKLAKWAGKHSTRLGAMIAGILTVGVIGGSFFANLIGENILNPLIEGGPSKVAKHFKKRTKDEGIKGLFSHLYDNRKPELMDVMLHIDDFATGAAISGLSFVEPFLALLYAFSGIRASIGYRNSGQPDFSPKQLKQAQRHLAHVQQRLKPLPSPSIHNADKLSSSANPTQVSLNRFVNFSA